MPAPEAWTENYSEKIVVIRGAESAPTFRLKYKDLA